MQAHTEKTRESFDCSKLDGIATIVRTHIVTPDGSTTKGRAHDCENCMQCGIAHRNEGGLGIDIHWEECVHPELGQASN